MKKFVTGEFIIQIVKVGPAGEELPPKSPPSKASTSSSIGKKPGPLPKPFLEKGDRAQRNDVAAIISEGHDKNALYKAASRQIGKDKGYVMRLMNRKPGMAKKLKKFHLLDRKNKGNI